MEGYRPSDTLCVWMLKGLCCSVEGRPEERKPDIKLTLSFLNSISSLLDRCSSNDGLRDRDNGRSIECHEGDDEGVDGVGEHGSLLFE
jgi:hypothetical protein